LKNAAMDFFGIKPDVSDAEKKAAEETTKALEEKQKAMDEAISKAKEFAERQAKMAQEITKVGDAYAYSNNQQLEAIALDTRLIGKTEDQKQMISGLADIYKQADNQIKALLDTRKQWAQGTEEQKASLGIIDAQVERIKKLRDTQVKEFEEYVTIQQSKKMLEEDRIRNLEILTKAIEDQTTRTLALGSARSALIEKTKEVDFQKTLAGLTPFQAQIAQIEEDARKAALEAGRAYAGAFEDNGDGLSPARARELSDGLNAIADGYKNIANKQIDALKQSRTFSDGWRRAFNEYADNATNAATRAQRIFEKFTSGIEDAIVNFAKTGKFEFKSFVESMMEELLRSQIKQTIAGLGKSFGLGDLFGGGGAAPGDSPGNPLYVIDISGGGAGGNDPLGSFINQLPGMNNNKQPGGGGGGIFDTIIGAGKKIFGGISDTVGSIFGGGSGGGGGGFLSGLGDLFGGFFANGGNLAAGQVGIVGERGPEMIGGPASITPLSGTNVTYNINAVDAASFKAMIARDPSFIHAVAQQGARTIPAKR
jgi:lambda family phage tail tape measure protein